MTRALTEEVCMETLQAAIHDWLDLAARRRTAFPGITVTRIPVMYRDFGTSYWDVQIVPSGGLRPMEVEVDEQAAVEEQAQGDAQATSAAGTLPPGGGVPHGGPEGG